MLALAGGGAALWSPGLKGGHLSPGARQVFEAVAKTVLDGVLPVAPAARAASLEAHIARLERTIAGLPSHVRQELSDLLALLSLPPGRYALTGLGTDWQHASAEQIGAAFQQMRTSSIATRQQVYLALRELTNAAYFAEPATWSAMGYPGPLAL